MCPPHRGGRRVVTCRQCGCRTDWLVGLCAVETWNTRAERTCTLHKTLTEPSTLEHMQEYECSECGGLTNAQVLNESDEPRYCMMCGARVAKEEL